VTQLALFVELWSQVRFQWWSDHPPAWSPMVEVVEEMLAAFGAPPPPEWAHGAAGGDGRYDVPMDAPSQPGGPPRRPRFLVTAGNTRERIDAVRDWGNVFTGTTGFEIAKALSAAGEVDLVTSNRSHLEWLLHASPAGAGPVRGTAFTTHEELKVALAAQMGRGPCDAVFMTAAVADYRPERVFEVLQRRPDPAGGRASKRGRSATCRRGR
jgi:hypothetical protein